MSDAADETPGECSTLDLSSRDFECYIPDPVSVGRSITDLNLAFNELSSLPDDLHISFPQLRKLDISGNQFSTLPSCIDQLDTLEVLNASENQLSSIFLSLLQLRNLKEISLVGNKLNELSDRIRSLISLEKLVLDENQISSLPDCICDLENLKLLEVSENNLEKLPQNIGRLHKLEILNLSRNDLHILPSSFRDLSNLKLLDVSHNELKNLPDTLKSAHGIQKLFAGDNILESLPNWFSDMKCVQVLCLKNNHIVSNPLPDEFSENLRGTLKSLHVGGNFIENLPDNLGELETLEFIHLGSVLPEIERANFQNGNWLRELPASFGNMRNLTRARLDENQLTCLPENIGNLVNLEFLDLGQNYLSSLPDSFCDLRSLKVCMLSKNRIRELPEEFGNLRKMEELKLDSNQLTELPKSLKNCVNVKILDLFDNFFKEVPDFLSCLTNLTALDLDDNDLGMDPMDVPCFNIKIYYSESRRDYGPRAQGGQEEKDSPREGLSVLKQALQNKKQLWAAHGQSGFRSKGVENRRTKNHMTNKHNKSGGTDDEEKEEGELTSDEDLDAGSSEEDESDDRVNHVQAVTEVEAEDWDQELEDENIYEIEVEQHNHPVINWKPRGQPVVDFLFVPSDDHPSGTPLPCFDENYEPGQFEDADD